MCVWAKLDESFHLHQCTGQTYMWKCVLGGESRLYSCRIGAKGRGSAVSRSGLLCSLKNGSLLDYFSSLAVKLSDSNLATGLQSGGHMLQLWLRVSFHVELLLLQMLGFTAVAPSRANTLHQTQLQRQTRSRNKPRQNLKTIKKRTAFPSGSFGKVFTQITH